MKDFNQTKAALILVQNLQNKNLAGLYDLKEFVKSICEVIFYSFESNGNKLNPIQRDNIMFSVTNPCYFLIDGFDIESEDMIVTSLSPRYDQKIESISHYFGKEPSKVVNLEKSPKSIVTKNNFLGGQVGIPNLVEQIALNLLNCANVLKNKERTFTKVEVKELLVYYTLGLIDEYRQNTRGNLPLKVVNQIFGQVKNASERVFNLPYTLISPEDEVLQNLNYLSIFGVTKKYQEYLIR